MPSAAPSLSRPLRASLRVLGERLRERRKALRVTASACAEAAGMSRVTLYRIEKGEPSVAVGAWLAAAAAVGLDLALEDPLKRTRSARPPPASIRLADYPQLAKLAWQLRGKKTLAPSEALELYERNWRHVETGALLPKERELIERLVKAFGRERLLV